jgi:hypothetical protein
MPLIYRGWLPMLVDPRDMPRFRTSTTASRKSLMVAPDTSAVSSTSTAAQLIDLSKDFPGKPEGDAYTHPYLAGTSGKHGNCSKLLLSDAVGSENAVKTTLSLDEAMTMDSSSETPTGSSSTASDDVSALPLAKLTRCSSSEDWQGLIEKQFATIGSCPDHPIVPSSSDSEGSRHGNRCQPFSGDVLVAYNDIQESIQKDLLSEGRTRSAVELLEFLGPSCFNISSPSTDEGHQPTARKPGQPLSHSLQCAEETNKIVHEGDDQITLEARYCIGSSLFSALSQPPMATLPEADLAVLRSSLSLLTAYNESPSRSPSPTPEHRTRPSPHTPTAQLMEDARSITSSVAAEEDPLLHLSRNSSPQPQAEVILEQPRPSHLLPRLNYLEGIASTITELNHIELNDGSPENLTEMRNVSSSPPHSSSPSRIFTSSPPVISSQDDVFSGSIKVGESMADISL